MAERRRTGTYRRQTTGTEGFSVFLPAPLPPDPPIVMDSDLQDRLELAGIALGRLDGITLLLPDPGLFMYMYIRKEAVLSSQIEGTQSSLSDLLLYENDSVPGVPESDAREVSNYVAAMEHGFKRLASSLPLSLRLIREIHEVLMREARGGHKTPGEFRRTQNWIGGSRPGNARYVPPSVPEMNQLLDNLEKFLHDRPTRTSPLIKAGLAHAQFESIHPFLDGNGRVGRLLITFILCVEKTLSEPLLYLSLYLKEHREEYYDALQAIRMEGDWEGWLRFFLRGVSESARQATETAEKLVRLFESDRTRIHQLRGANTALRVHEILKKRVVLSVPETARRLKVTRQTVDTAVGRLEGIGLVKEMTGRSRDRLFGYSRYLRILNEGIRPEL